MPLPDDVRTRLVALEQQATRGPIRFSPENGCLVDERGDIVADVQPLDEQDCILTALDGEYLAALWTAAPTLLASDAWVGKALMFLRQLSDNGIAQTSVIKGARALLREAEDAPRATEG
jgi:hypothetical protein